MEIVTFFVNFTTVVIFIAMSILLMAMAVTASMACISLITHLIRENKEH